MHLFRCLYYCISDTRQNKHQIYKHFRLYKWKNQAEPRDQNQSQSWKQEQTKRHACRCRYVFKIYWSESKTEITPKDRHHCAVETIFKMNRLSQILMNSARRDGTHRNLMISWKLAALCLYFVSLWHCHFNLQVKMLSKRQANVCNTFISNAKWKEPAEIRSVYREPCNIDIYPKDVTLHSSFISRNCCTCFGWYLHPLSGARQLYLRHLAFTKPLLLPAAIVEELELQQTASSGTRTTVYKASDTCQTVTATCRYCRTVGTALQSSSNCPTIVAGSSNGLTSVRCFRYSCACSWWCCLLQFQLFHNSGR